MNQPAFDEGGPCTVQGFNYDALDGDLETEIETTPREMAVTFGILLFMSECMTSRGMLARFTAVAEDVAPEVLNGKSMARIAAEAGVSKQSFHQAREAWRIRKAAVVAAATNEEPTNAIKVNGGAQ